ncbi:hypothetical protein IQ06DRAFT_140619 [Phaeosphaeriaceae sp. SRC1lsM3a]|nr:hypothetical protein IQ06DRAFT_140619 [Stagonospora sp. SRC1lsM3a]
MRLHPVRHLLLWAMLRHITGQRHRCRLFLPQFTDEDNHAPAFLLSCRPRPWQGRSSSAGPEYDAGGHPLGGEAIACSFPMSAPASFVAGLFR